MAIYQFSGMSTPARKKNRKNPEKKNINTCMVYVPVRVYSLKLESQVNAFSQRNISSGRKRESVSNWKHSNVVRCYYETIYLILSPNSSLVKHDM